jgi:V/A-type H+-transporting ATPase subunit I
MIVPMKKYSFLIYHKEYEEFLDGLRDAGVLHVIEKQSGEIEDGILRDNYNLINQLNNAIRFLKKREVEQEPDEAGKDGLTILKEIQNIQDERETNTQKIDALMKDIRTVEPWGDFSMSDIRKLKEHCLSIRFWITSSSKFKEEWLGDYNLEIINESGGQKYFVVVQEEDEKLEIDAEEVRLPEISLSELNKQTREINGILKKSGEVLDLYAKKYIALLENTRDDIIRTIDYDKVILSTEKQAEEKVMVLEGWVPSDKEELLLNYLDKKGILYVKSKPEPGDKIPIRLKNNWFAKLFEPVGKLYSLPNYAEIDLTPFFAPFFMLFFGFCLGDAGYGLLFVIIATIAKRKVKPAMKSLLTLVQLLGLSTVIMGTITGTLFGIPLFEKNLPVYSDIQRYFKEHDTDINQQMFNWALMIGAVQIIYGMFLRAFNKMKQFGFRYSLSTFGWILALISGGFIYAAGKNQVPDILLITGYVLFSFGGILVLFFNNPDKNILVNFGLGLYDVYSMATSLIGDLLSYIRLFALGVSSAILGFVFNEIAIGMSPDIPVLKQIVFLIIILFGHGINIFMATLGSFVHPMRLTFVEFYKNAGFTGGGKEYKPFKK